MKEVKHKGNHADPQIEMVGTFIKLLIAAFGLEYGDVAQFHNETTIIG